MPAILPGTARFRAPVYGTVFGNRAAVVDRLNVGDELILVPDPPGIDDPNIWVHARGGDVIGHLAPDLNAWLVPWMLGGKPCRAAVATVHKNGVESWKRLVIEVRCRAGSPRRA